MSEEDEIDLIDLFVVLLRYRRLIIIPVLFSLVLAVAGWFWYPRYRYNNAPPEETEAVIMLIPGPAVQLAEKKISLNKVFNKPEIIHTALKAAGYLNLVSGEGRLVSLEDSVQRSKAFFLIRNRFLDENSTRYSVHTDNKDENIKADNTIDNEVITITFRDTDPEKAAAFLNALVDQAGPRVREALEPYAATVISSHERMLAAASRNETLLPGIWENAERYATALGLLSGKAPVLIRIGDVTVIEPDTGIHTYREGFKIKALVLVFAVFFLSIFLAFIANAVSQIKKDPESMEKIRDALGKKRS
jgi:hypothetical protein